MAGCGRPVSRVVIKTVKNCRLHSKTNQELCIYFSWIDLLPHVSDIHEYFFFIFNCRSRCLPLILLLTKTDVSSRRYRGLLMWCLSFVLRNNSSCSSGASLCCGSPRHRQEGNTSHNVQRPIPFRMMGSVSQRAPPRAPGSRATPVRQDTTEGPRLCVRGDCAKTHADELLKTAYISFITRRNRTQWQRKREKKKQTEIKEQNQISVKLLRVPPSKNICRGREGGKRSERRGRKREKRKQAFYNFKEKEAVEWTGENIYSGN